MQLSDVRPNAAQYLPEERTFVIASSPRNGDAARATQPGCRAQDSRSLRFCELWYSAHASHLAYNVLFAAFMVMGTPHYTECPTRKR